MTENYPYLLRINAIKEQLTNTSNMPDFGIHPFKGRLSRHWSESVGQIIQAHGPGRGADTSGVADEGR